MIDRSRRVFLGRVARAAGAALLVSHGALRARRSRADELAISGIGNPDLASFDESMMQFVKEQQVPGAALAVTKDSRLVYARGFGLADRDRRRPVQPGSLFRIASISKPITAVAVLQLVERSKLSLDAGVWELLELPEPTDARWKQVTIRHLLQHTGGWDREASVDPMFRAAPIARKLGVAPPAQPQHVIRYMLGEPLDFDPGSRYAYSNFGYCLLGRAIERVAGVAYESFVQREILEPLGIRGMRLGKTDPAQRASNEVSYYGEGDRPRMEVAGTARDRRPAPLGTWSLEVMDSHGGWIASAAHLARFASSFDVPATCRILQPESIATLFARPAGPAGYEADGKPKPVYYACGWNGRSIGQRGLVNLWHTGSLDGSSTLLVRRHDHRNWAVLFNANRAPDGQRLATKIDRILHQAADRVRRWPDVDQFPGLLES